MENNQLPTHTKILYATQGNPYCAKLNNKQSAKAICKFDRLRTVHSKSQKAIRVMENLLATHAYDYIVLRINLGLTSSKDLATVVWTIISACKANYVLPCRYAIWIINLQYCSHAYYRKAILIQYIA